MHISVTGRHVKITDTMKEHAYAQVERHLIKYDRIEDIHIILEVEKYRQIAEIVVQAKNHIRIEAEACSEDMYASIDKAVEKAAKQLQKQRDKVQNHKANEGLGQLEREVLDSKMDT